MTPLPDEEIKRILVVMAHPDDCDFGAGGTIAQWTSRGIEVSYCIITNGDQGGEASDFPLEEMAQVRQREQRAAGKELGVENVTYLNYRDGSLFPHWNSVKILFERLDVPSPTEWLCNHLKEIGNAYLLATRIT